MPAAIRRTVVAASVCIAIVGATNAIAVPRRGGSDPRGDERRAEVTFTKWVTVTPGYPLMEGFTGGEAAGTFTGEIFDFQTTADNLISRLVAVYEIQAGPRSFKAMIEGGSDNVTGKGLLTGKVLSGWMRGADVLVQFNTIACTQPNAANRTCFQGTIRLTDNSDE